MELDARLQLVVAEQPYPLLFVTISGAHLYGFASPDSDYDVRGVHVLPAKEALGLLSLRETIEISSDREGLEIDLVTHDAKKFFQLLLTRNGYVLEQLYSPLVLLTTPEHDELRAIAEDCITRNHAHHYLGFARTQWGLFEKGQPPRVKPLLYVYRVLLTGIHLMRTGEVEASLPRLNEHFNLTYIADLIAQKTSTRELCELPQADFAFHRQEYERLTTLLEQSSVKSALPDASFARPALNDLLIRLRIGPKV